MGFWNYFFPNAGEIAMLTRQCAFLQAEREKLEFKVDALEKEVRRERNRAFKVMTTYCDQVSTQNGLYAKFEKVVEEKKKPPEPTPPVLTPAEETELERIARDLWEKFGQDRPLDQYVRKVKSEPEHYLQ